MLPVSEAINAFADMDGKNLYCCLDGEQFDLYAFFAHHIQDNHPELLNHLRYNFDNVEDVVKYLNTQCHRGAPFACRLTNEFSLSPPDTLEMEK